ncbi:hypothetical protein, partial [Thiolapillus sp.]|uniref:hypothetical protein n=1 Tax=Thiolapillus sp. TaxID=2017437 RepID=UPI00263A80B7
VLPTTCATTAVLLPTTAVLLPTTAVLLPATAVLPTLHRTVIFLIPGTRFSAFPFCLQRTADSQYRGQGKG